MQKGPLDQTAATPLPGAVGDVPRPSREINMTSRTRNSWQRRISFPSGGVSPPAVTRSAAKNTTHTTPLLDLRQVNPP